MAKKRNTKRQRPKPSVTNSGATDDDAGNDQQVGWSAIPGKHLPVDIANEDENDNPSRSKRRGGKKRQRPTTTKPQTSAIITSEHADEVNSGDEFAIENWTSHHYDHSDDESLKNERVDDDLFDPDPLHRENKFDAGAKLEGANDAGMFLSLEVIPAGAYQVQKTGDETSGFVTKVVFNKAKSLADDDAGGKLDQDASDTDPPKKDNKRERARKKREAREAAGEKPKGKPKPKTEEEIKADATARLDRKKLKRKAKKDAAKERKKLRREKSETTSSSQSKESQDGASEPEPSSSPQEDVEEEAVSQLSTTWSIAAPGLSLHTTLASGLHTLQYSYPTPIQSATLPAAILGRRDIVGAAPTGSGKTLSYGLPILQYLLENESTDQPSIDEPSTGATTQPTPDSSSQQRTLQALVLTPTRELAMQVTLELQKVSMHKIKIGTIVGGFAEVKQKRTLEKVRPPVIVATPGRLWELMSSKDYTHLNDLTQLRFLVIDEADRMIKQGSFPQLKQIFELINLANPPPEEDDSDDESESDDDDDDRMKGLAGVRGEAKLVMLDDSILEAIERQRNGGLHAPQPMEMDDDEYEQQKHLLDDEDEGDSDNDSQDIEPVHRQTFVYSATLTLPPSMHNLIKKDPEIANKKRRRNRGATTVDGAIAEILDIAGARGQTKVCDLSNTVPEGKNKKNLLKDADRKKGQTTEESPSMARRLPPGLTLGEIPCAQRHKDSHLYAYLVTTRQGSSGPCLVFCNSIAAVRRVGDTLKTLGLPVKMLHAQMMQKSRLGALESLRTSNSRSIVVCSDVAARGLDISSVTTVIHYDVARVVDTFIHRAGRTARGVGDKAVGTSVSLVAPAEEREHQKICEAVRGGGFKSLEQVHIDSRLLNEAQERVALATKIVSCNDVETQASRKNKWLQDAAKEAGLEVDDDMLEGGLLDGDKRDRQRFLEAKRARHELRELLAKPMRKQHFGKFLSGAGLRDSIKSEVEVKPYVVKETSSKRKRSRRS